MSRTIVGGAAVVVGRQDADDATKTPFRKPLGDTEATAGDNERQAKKGLTPKQKDLFDLINDYLCKSMREADTFSEEEFLDAEDNLPQVAVRMGFLDRAHT